MVATLTACPLRQRVLGGLLLCVAFLGLWWGSFSAAYAAGSEAKAENRDHAVAVVRFDRNMLSGGAARNLELSRFEKGATVLPGTYNVDVYLNKRWLGRTNVRFQAPHPNENAVPCLTRELISRMQVKVSSVDVQSQLSQPGACVQLGNLIPQAKEHFDMNDLRLYFTVPQVALKETPRDYVSPSSWSTGVPAFLLNYQFNAFRNDYQGLKHTSAFLGLDSGLNIGAWRIRQRSTLNWATGYQGSPSQHHWHGIELYARRALPDLSSEMTFGDSYTDGSVFNSYALLGVQLATDDRMRAPSRRGYAPVVRGVAHSNAKVTISQNGVELYQTTVPPGPFVINDLYPTGYGGALHVTVTEADGSKRTYEVPYASVSQLQRPGVTRYSVDAGQLRDLGQGIHPNVFQAAVQHGFSNLFSGYAGVQASGGYGALLVGAALNTRAGAFAIDLTQAHADIPGYGTHSGKSLRLSWSKMITATRTQFSVAAYRYSTRGFLSLREAATARQYASEGLNPFVGTGGGTFVGTSFISPENLRRRNRFTLSLSQPLGADAGSLYGNATYSDYWGHQGSSSTFQIGYQNRLGPLSYSISLARTRIPGGGYDDSADLTLSVPLGGSQAPTLTANLNHDSQQSDQQQATVSGSFGHYNQFAYSASLSHGGGGTSTSVGMGYTGSHGVYNASYSSGDGYSQVSVGTSGSVVAHQGGVTFGQPLSSTIGIVHAPGAVGAHVEGAPNVQVDSQGYAIVPNLTPFQRNTVRLDPQGAGLGVQLEATSDSVAPYAGAVVMLNFKTHYGRALLVRLHRADGLAVPFGADVVDARGKSVGVVGQSGRALLTVHGTHGNLTAHWSAAGLKPASCRFHFALKAKASGNSGHSYREVDATCTQGSKQ